MLLRKSLVLISFMIVLISFKAFQMSSSKSAKEDAFAKAADVYFQSVLDELGSLPGVAIAIVKDDKPIYVKGLGYGNVEKKTKANAHTNFYIASCTKSFTSLLAMRLDEKNIIKLNDPITKYLPEVRFDPKLEADKITMLDLLRHTSGLDNGPITYRVAYSGDHNLKTLVELLNYTEPNRVGKGNFQYSNFGYNLYSIIVDKVTGKPWQQWLEEEIFQPMGMNRTTAYMSKVAKNKWDMALPYRGLIGQAVKPVYLIKNDQNMQAAGGLITTASDAAKWLEMQLNDGKLKGKQIFPKAMIDFTHQKLAETKETGGEAPEFGRSHYGMGWRVGDYKGHDIISHFGGYPGYLTHISLLPKEKIGITVLTNEGNWGDNVMNLFAAFTYDWWLGEPDVMQKYEQKKKELLEHCKNVSQRIAASEAERAKRTWQLDQPFAAYSGTYASDLMGTVEVKGDAEKIEVSMGSLRSIATPFTEKNAIRVELVPGQGEVIQFEYENDKLVGLRNGQMKFIKVK